MKKTLALVLAVLLIAAVTPFAMAANVSSITIAVPEIKGVQMTLTDVQPLYYYGSFIFNPAMNEYSFYIGASGSVTFSKDVTMNYYDASGNATPKDVKGSTPVSVKDINGGTLPFDDAKSGFIGFYSDTDPTYSSGMSSAKSDINDLAVAAPASPSTAPAAPSTSPAAEATAVPSAQSVLVNGVSTAFDAYNIDGHNYFKLRDLASALSGSAKQFSISIKADTKQIDLKSGAAYTAVGGEMTKGDGTSKSATLSAWTVFLDGKQVTLTAYNIGGNNYFQLRDLGSAINFGVTYDSATNTIKIDTSTGYAAG